MALRVFAGISLRNEEGVHFGTMMRIKAAMAGIQTDGVYRVGDRLEFQLELTGFDADVHGIADVVKAELHDEAMNRYLLRIRKMPRADQALVQEWYDQLATDGQASLLSAGAQRALDSQVQSRLPSDLPGLPPPKPAGRPPAGCQEEFTFSDSISRDRGGMGRTAIRAVLQAASKSKVRHEPRVRQVDPLVNLDMSSSPPFATVRYLSPQAWHAAWQTHLRHQLLFIEGSSLRPALDAAFDVNIVYAPQVDQRCSARVVLLHPMGFGLALDVDPAALAEMVSGATVETLEQAQPSEPAAPSEEPPWAAEATVEQDRSFWLQLFGLEARQDSLEEALAELESPTAPLRGLDAAQRRRLEELLASEGDYIAISERVASMLRGVDWQWPELERLTARSTKAAVDAGAFLLLAWLTRNEAIEALRAAQRKGTALVTVQAGPTPSCRQCASRTSALMSPVELVRRGLPPYHPGCQCRVVSASED